MRIDSIDVYRVKLPLRFVWRTSYGDQTHSDTILVRMAAGGHHGWGESCPVSVPSYSAEHTLATFHTLREHMVPRVIGQDVESAADLLDRLSVDDLGKPEIVLSGRGEVATSTVPGIAQEPDPELLARWTVERASFPARG